MIFSKNVAIALIIIAVIVFVGNMEMALESLFAVRNSDGMFGLPVGEGTLGRIRKREAAAAAMIPKFQVSSLYSDEHARVDNEDPVTRCDRYNLKPYDGPPRRIFYGTMVADENWEVHLIHAIEVYDIYHVAVFVESNTTHMATPRPLRYKDSKEADQLTRSGMFGPKTNVYIDFWLEDIPDLKDMERESEQRNTIIKRWKDAGMMPEDVGLMSDADEIVSRDFLRAIQTCDFPELQPDESCKTPKITTASIPIEASPYCVNQKTWFHPDLIGGRCVEGIGDPTERIIPLRNHKRMYGERHASYGKQSNSDYPEVVHTLGRYPLFTGPDIRTVHGHDMGLRYNMKAPSNIETTAVYRTGAAYHLHNWFAEGEVIRHKYLTYAHGWYVDGKTLSQIHGDLDLSVRCVKGIDNEANPYNWMARYHLDGRNIEGPRPIYFLNVTYAEERHKLLHKMILDDEAKHGTSYDSSGNWIVNSLLGEEERKKELADWSGSIRPEVLAARNASNMKSATTES